VDGIPYARAGRDALRHRVAELLGEGDVDGARVALLADADDWWDAAPPPDEQLARVASATTLREAMDLLGMGRVGDYFAHRWSDPTYLAGLALLQQHWPADRAVVEVACGAGHLLRELAQRGLPDLVGVDVVWAKLWLAQRFVCPSARYVCADVTDLPDLEVAAPAYVLCHDALYFVRDKAAAAAAMLALAGPGGTVVVGHAHVADPHGAPVPAQDYARLLGAEHRVRRRRAHPALLAGRPPSGSVPRSSRPRGHRLSPGTCCSRHRTTSARPVGPLRLNPLYADGALEGRASATRRSTTDRTDYLPDRASRCRPTPPGGASSSTCRSAG
jgi:SAM-dependent methyltransferase